MERALLRSRDERRREGPLRLFDALSAYLTAERDDISCANLAATLGVAQGTVKRLLYHMRQRYRWLLRDDGPYSGESRRR